MIAPNIPEGAHRCAYIHGAVTIHYYVWGCMGPAGKKWCWHALGNEGIEESKTDAEAAARRWITTRQ